MKKKGVFLRGFLSIILLLIATRGWAQEPPKVADDPLEALKLEVARNPKDALAWANVGLAQNELGQYVEAEASLRQALALEREWGWLNFNLGVSIFAQDRIEEALRHFRAAVQADPESARAHWMLGHTLLRTGELAAAKDHIRRAAEIEPERYREGALAIEARLARIEKPWRLAFSVGAGYDTNVIALAGGLALPRGISHKRSGFGRFTLDASYDWRPSRDDTITMGYGFLADVYGRVSNFNLLDHLVYVNYRRNFGRDLVGGIRISNEFSLLDEIRFRNQVGVRPALAYRLTEWNLMELAYTFGASDYFVAIPKVRNRDSRSSNIALINYFRVPGTQLQGRLGYFHVWNRADGGDFDFDSNGLLLGLSHPLFWQVTGELLYTRSFDRYPNLNSFAGPAGFESRRKDDVDTLTMQLSRPVTELLRTYVRYDFTNDDSKVPFFNYKRHIFSAGFVIEF